MRLLLMSLAFSLVASSALAVTKVQEVDAANGAKALLIEDHSLPVVTVKIEVNSSGAAYDPQGREGLANFAMQMFNEGAGSMDSLAFNHALEENAIKLGSEAGEDSVIVGVQTLSEFKDNAFDLLDLALNKPRFDSDAVERVRTNILTEIKQADENPTYIAALKWKESAFPDHPYRHPRIGTAQSVAHISREDMQQFQGKTLSCNAKDIAVVGDITAAEVKNLLLKLLPERKCESKLQTISNAKIRDGIEPVTVVKQVPQTVVEASLPGVLRNDSRYYSLFLLSDILGGDIFTSRLGREIRDKRGLAYYAESNVDVLDHAGYLAFGFATRSDQLKNALTVFLDELKKMQEKGITQVELDQAKRYITGSFPLNLDGQNSLASYLLQMQHYHLGNDYLDRRNDLINAVTLADVNTLAKELFSHKPLIVMVGMPEGSKQ
jgi:zinc protease